MIIDTHGHTKDVNYPIYSTDVVDAATMIDAMDRFEIEQMWISPTSGMVNDCHVHNKIQYENFKKLYPKRFVNFAVVNPYYPEQMKEEIKICFEEYGFQGIKIHSWLQSFFLHQPGVYYIMEQAAKYNVPVLFHDGTPPYSDTLQIAGLAERYPEVQVILGHAGLYDQTRSAIQACNLHENVWLCLMGTTIGETREVFRDVKRKDHLVFGSDYCCGGAGRIPESIIPNRIDTVRIACPSQELYEQVMYWNAKKLIDV